MTTPRAKVTGRWSWNAPLVTYYLLLSVTVFLVIIGLVMVLSSSSVEQISRGNSPYATFFKQARFAVIGILGMVVCSRIPPGIWRKCSWIMFLGAIGLQALVFTPLGFEWGGNRNWLNIAGQSIQPSEFMKLALAAWLGAVLATKQQYLNKFMHIMIPAVPGAILGIGLVAAGKDLGTVMVLSGIFVAALWVAGVPGYIFGGIAVAGVGGIALMAVTSENRMRRINSWLSADCDVQGECYQSSQGLRALGSGDLLGVGLGNSRQKWAYLPEAHNDYIYAIVGEELGLLGAVLILVLFFILGVAMTRLIRRHPDPFVKITTAGIFAWILGQSFINIGVVIGVFPVIGVPLPLVSDGGSALVATLAAIGVLLSFARDEPGAGEALQTNPRYIRKMLTFTSKAR